MKRLFLPLLAIVLTTSTLAQDAHPLRLTVDAAAFRYDEQNSYLEVYYAVTRSSLAWVRQDASFSAAAVFQATLERIGSTGQPTRKLWRVPVQVQDTSGLADKHLMGKVHHVCVPGKYRITITARDENAPGRVDSVGLSFTVQRFPTKTPAFSDIELCSSIGKSEPDSSNIFYKNTLEVIPNPTLLYGKSFSSLPYYMEVYNLMEPTYRLRREIISSYGKTVSSDVLTKAGRNAARVEYGSIAVGRLPSGAYTLVFTGLDTSGTILASSSKLFYIFNPDVPFDTAMIRQVGSEIALEFAALSEKELDEEFEKAAYVANSVEKETWKAIAGSEAKKKFLTKFWEERDIDRSTPENEYYQEYIKRIQEANDQYRTAYRPGWKTDRGRIWVTYGKPDTYERMAAESDTKPYEIWYYDRYQSGVQFVFVDKGGFNNYELVHSTMRNELNDTNWQRYIKTY